MPLVRPGSTPPAVSGPAVRAGAVKGFRALQLGARHHGFRRGFARRHGVPLLVLQGDGYYGPYFDPGDGTAVLSPSARDVIAARPTPPGEPVVVDGRVCFAQSYLVPSEAGGTKPVRVTRC
jgi:hypothetical protein